MDSDNVLVGQQLTHPERVIDPASGTTKLDLARYYATVAPLIQPHLLHRPVALVRAPDGLSGELFFHFTMTPVPHLAGLRPSSIQQVYQSLRRVQHMPVLSET